jgi:deoxyadenosine/deoxycytidine kinase
MAGTQIVYVCGNNASGKTTLAKALSDRLGFQHLPEQKFDTTYLDDLFVQQRRWSFEAQIHFLSFKVELIRACCESESSAFIDRSPYEDAEVFARAFYETRKMDRRSYRTYRDVYQILGTSLPEPHLLIMCRCSIKEIMKRVHSRGREYEQRYPKHHLRLLDDLYEDWLGKAAERFADRLVQIDSEGIDFRTDTSTLDSVALEVRWRLTNRSNQLSLFDDEATDHAGALARPQSEFLRPIVISKKASRRTKRKPVVYIAAPFTGKAPLASQTPARKPAEPEMAELLWETSPPHGVLDPEYRGYLEWIEQIVRSCNCETFIPHRDINGWGENELTAEQVAEACTSHVFASDIMVAFPATSFGTHYEIGLAIGYGIPTLLLLPNEETTSFIMEGLVTYDSVQVVNYGSKLDLAESLRLKISDLVAKSLR